MNNTITEFVVTKDPKNSNWTCGYIILTDNNNNKHKYTWEVKHFDAGSSFGINNGRISKLFVLQEDKQTYDKTNAASLFNGCVINYDRGWDIKPEDDMTNIVYQKLLEEYN